VPAEELVGVLLSIEPVGVLDGRGRLPSHHARDPSDRCESKAVIVSAMRMHPASCVLHTSCMSGQHTCSVRWGCCAPRQFSSGCARSRAWALADVKPQLLERARPTAARRRARL
jgi:hypothetical protein